MLCMYDGFTKEAQARGPSARRVTQSCFAKQGDCSYTHPDTGLAHSLADEAGRSVEDTEDHDGTHAVAHWI